MSRLVKILLAILAALLVAAGGFWSGTRFAYQQVAADSSRQAAVIAPSAQAQGQSSAAPQDNQTPQGDSRRQNNNGPWGNTNNDDTRQSDQSNRFGPGMMGSNGPRQWGNTNQDRPSAGNFGPMMPGFNNNETSGMMAVRQHNGGFGMFAGGSFLSGVFMFFGLIFPLGFGILMVLGIIILFRMVRQPSPAPAAVTTPCTKCGASLQAGWSYCAHCGEPILK
jgi:hypothetical protein